MGKSPFSLTGILDSIILQFYYSPILFFHFNLLSLMLWIMPLYYIIKPLVPGFCISLIACGDLDVLEF